MKNLTKFTKSAVLALSLAAAMTINAGPALASGGGGGGGGSFSGGASAPQYDPVEEYKKGIAYMDAKDYKSALRSFKRVLKVASKDANTNYLAGLASTGLGKDKNAARYYGKASRYNPDLYDAYKAEATAYMNIGKDEKAAKVLAKLEKRIADCTENCAALETTRDAVAAIIAGTAQQESSLAPSVQLASADTQYFSAIALINQGKYEEAITELNVMASALGPHPDVMNYLGYAHRKLGMYERAENYYLTALAVDPLHKGANEYLGELYVETRQLGKARMQLAKLSDICSFGCIEEVELRGWITNAAP